MQKTLKQQFMITNTKFEANQLNTYNFETTRTSCEAKQQTNITYYQNNSNFKIDLLDLIPFHRMKLHSLHVNKNWLQKNLQIFKK